MTLSERFSHSYTATLLEEMEDKNKCYTDLMANRSDSEYVEGLKTWYKKASATFYSTTALREKTDN